MSVFSFGPEAFKRTRTSLKPVNPIDFIRLHFAVKGVVAEYLTGDIELERVGFCRTKAGQLVDTRLFGEGHPRFGKLGVITVAGVAPTAPEPVNLFVLSSDGTSHWVTHDTDDRSITSLELDDLVGQLGLDNLVPFKKYGELS